METFFASYGVLWLAVMLYVGRMGLRQRRLERSINELIANQAQAEKAIRSQAKAA